jgi:hypothetical protein
MAWDVLPFARSVPGADPFHPRAFPNPADLTRTRLPTYSTQTKSYKSIFSFIE